MSKFEVVTIEALNIYRSPSEPARGWVRDVEVGEAAKLAVPRDVRRHIKKLIADGTVALIKRDETGVAANHAGQPATFVESEGVTSGSGTVQEVDVYYLNEEAALLLIMRLRTPVAIELQKKIVRVFLAFTRGELAPPALPQSAPARPALGDKLDRLLCEVDRLEVLGLYDATTAWAHRVRLYREHEGYDFATAPPQVVFERCLAVPVSSLQLGTGGAAIVPVADVAGHKTATAIGAHFGVSAQLVGRVADELGIRPSIRAGDTTYGVAISHHSNGRECSGDKQVMYNAVAEARMAADLAREEAAQVAKASARTARRDAKAAKKAAAEAARTAASN